MVSLEALQESTTVIIIKDSDPLLVETQKLTACSPVFKYLLEKCKFEEHDMSDFCPDAVRVFLTLLDDGQLVDIEDTMFREINKLAAVFQIAWLQDDCKKWIGNKMLTEKTVEQQTFLFEESYFMLNRLGDKEYMEMFVNQFGQSDDVTFISKYLSDFQNLDGHIVYPLVQLGGSNIGFFYKTLFESVVRNSQLTKNALFMLQSINLRCLKPNWEEWSDLLNKIADLPEISMSDLRITFKLLDEAWRVISSDNRKKEPVSIVMLFDYNKWRVLRDKCSSLPALVTSLVEGEIDSVWQIVWLLLGLFRYSSPCQEEVDQFVYDIESFGVEKQLQRVPWQVIDPLITTLKYSTKDKAENLVALLTCIRQSKVLSSPNRENTVIRRDECKAKHIYKFKHPGSGRCTKHGECGFIIRDHTDSNNWKLELATDSSYYRDTDLHYHDVISARDMCVYKVYTLILPGGVKLDTIDLPGVRWRWDWWFYWLPHGTRDKLKGCYVSYNMSDYMVAKLNHYKV